MHGWARAALYCALVLRYACVRSVSAHTHTHKDTRITGTLSTPAGLQPLSYLDGAIINISSAFPTQDLPVLTNFYGSVGTGNSSPLPCAGAHTHSDTRTHTHSRMHAGADTAARTHAGAKAHPSGDEIHEAGPASTCVSVCGLTQVLLPPFLDMGVPLCDMTVDGGAPVLTAYQWTPTGIHRWGATPTSTMTRGRRHGAGDVAAAASMNESTPRASTRGDVSARTHTHTRMLFEGYGVIQRLAIDFGDGENHAVSMQLQATMRNLQGQLGWTWLQTGNVSGFSHTLVRTQAGTLALLSCDADTPACAVWTVFPQQSFELASNGVGAVAAWSMAGSDPLELSLALAVAETATEAVKLANTLSSQDGFNAAWDAFEQGWSDRWHDAFAPKVAGSDAGHFSGNLPTLDVDQSSKDAQALQRLYYMSAYTVLASERTNLPSLFPRVYLTATGNPSMSYAIGGTVQFAWDQSFYSFAMALLDPIAMRADLANWVGRNITAYFGIELDNMEMVGYFYAFNAISLFRTYSAYLRVTNDTAFLQDATQMLMDLAQQWRAYAGPNSFLADYCASPDCYLECVPTYVHAVAGLQASNAYMALDVAGLLRAAGNESGAVMLENTAASIARESIAKLYVTNTTLQPPGPHPASGDVGGWWRALNTSNGQGTEVRHVVDLVYTAAGFCSAARPWPCFLTAQQRKQMVDFAVRQLIIPSNAWLRALSPNDSLHYVPRPDHGTTGAYDAWPALLFDALTYLTGDFSKSIPFLVALSKGTTHEGPFGQAHEIAADGVSVFKTFDGFTRYLANNGGAFIDNVVRTIFAYDPAWLSAELPQPATLREAERGVAATLRCLRGPDGASFLTATVGGSQQPGVQYEWSTTC